MDLTKIDELDARQKALDEERAQARKAVLKEIQYLINRIDAKPEELTFPAGKILTKRSRRSKKPDGHNLPRKCSLIPPRTSVPIEHRARRAPCSGLLFLHMCKNTLLPTLTGRKADNLTPSHRPIQR